MVYFAFLIFNLMLLAMGSFGNVFSATQAMYVDNKSQVFYAPGFPADASGWKQIDGAVKGLAITDGGKAICVGTDNAIWYSDGVEGATANWKKQNDTMATRVAAGGDIFLHIAKDGSIRRFSGTANADGSMAWQLLDAPIGAKVTDIAVNAEGQMLCVANNIVYYSFGLDESGKPNWIPQKDSWATRVAIGNGGEIACIGRDNIMYFYKGEVQKNVKIPWKQIAGKAKEIAFGPDGQMVCVGMNNALYSLEKGKTSWVKQEKTNATFIALSKELSPVSPVVVSPVADQGMGAAPSASQAMYADNKSQVFYSPGFPADASGWKKIDGAVKGLAIADNGKAICIGTNDVVYSSGGVEGDKANWKKQNNTWASRVAAGGDIFLYIEKDGSIRRFSGMANADGSMAWQPLDAPIGAKVTDIAVNTKGQMLCVANNIVYYSFGLDESGKPNWIPQKDSWATRVAIGNGGEIACIGRDNIMYFYKGEVQKNVKIPWKQIAGKAKEIAFGPDGQMVCVGMNNALYSLEKGKTSWVKQEKTNTTFIALSKGGASSVAVAEKGIISVARPAVPTVVPADFVLEQGSANAVASGCDDKGEPTAYVIGNYGTKIYSYDSHSFVENPWTAMTSKTAISDTDDIKKFLLISASSSGELVAVRENGKVVEYDFGTEPAPAAKTVAATPVASVAAVTSAKPAATVKPAPVSRRTTARSRAVRGKVSPTPAATVPVVTTSVATPSVETVPAVTVVAPVATVSTKDKWLEVPGELKNIKDIAVGDDKYLFAIGGEEKGIYQHNGTAWEKIKVTPEAKNAAGVACGADGVIFALNESGTCLEVKDGTWSEISSPVKFSKIYAGNKDNVIAVAKDLSLWRLNSKDNKFEIMKSSDGKNSSGWRDAAINAYGMVFLCDVMNKIYHNEEAGAPAPVAAVVPAAAVATTVTPATAVATKTAASARGKRATRTSGIKSGTVARPAAAKTTSKTSGAVRKVATRTTVR